MYSSNSKDMKYLNKVINSEEYIHNKMQIDCIKNVLIKHSDVPEQLLNWLIESVERNAELVANAKIESSK